MTNNRAKTLVEYSHQNANVNSQMDLYSPYTIHIFWRNKNPFILAADMHHVTRLHNEIIVRSKGFTSEKVTPSTPEVFSSFSNIVLTFWHIWLIIKGFFCHFCDDYAKKIFEVENFFGKKHQKIKQRNQLCSKYFVLPSSSDDWFYFLIFFEASVVITKAYVVDSVFKISMPFVDVFNLIFKVLHR